MPTEEMKKFISLNSEKEKIQLQLAMHCGPFLKGLKDSCIFMFSDSMTNELCVILKKLNISFSKISKSDNKTVIFLYRKNQLATHLSKKNIRDFLKKYNYKENNVEGMLMVLKERMVTYYVARDIFPHEIGIFLGYPIEDVKGFIENEGKNFLISGYWKVYQDENKARKLFADFDMAKEVAIREILAGRKLEEIAC